MVVRRVGGDRPVTDAATDTGAGGCVHYGRRSMSGHCSRRARAFTVALALGLPTLAGPAAATTPNQDSEGDDGVVEDEGFDENETEGTIDRVRLQLLAIAAVTGGLLVVYIWHTDPQRRQRVADRRRDDRERVGLVALDDEFVLPGDLEDGSDDVPDGGDEADESV